MEVQLKCGRCGGKIYEDDFYVELGKKKVELSCYQCPQKYYYELKSYRKSLEKIVKSR